MALSPLSPLPPTASLRKDHNIVVRIIEAKNLPPDCTDMYGVVRIDNDTQNQFKTRTIWRSRTPFWDEEDCFQLGRQFNDIYVEVYNKSKFTNTLIGYCKLPKLSLELDNRNHEDWHPLHAPKKGDAGTDAPNEQLNDSDKRPHEFKPHAFNAPVSCDQCGKMIWGSKKAGCKCTFCGLNCHKEDCEAATSKLSCGSVGVVRIRYKYTDEYILPLPTYAKLLESFMSKSLNVIVAYGAVTEEREEAAKTLVRISEYTGHVVDFLGRLLTVEVAQCADPNTIFRANSLASKAVDYYMKFTGMPYLTNVLKPVMDEIISANRSCEVDPTRLEKGEEIEANRVILSAYMEWIFSRIVDSVTKCPSQLKQVFHNLAQEVINKWPENDQARYTCVSGFIFLRFFNAAILGPKLFGLCSEHPNQRVSRTLTLLSKSMQQLANLVRFDGKKEPYMTPFNNFIITNMDRMKTYIRKLSSLEAEPAEKSPESPNRGRRSTIVEKSMPWKKQKGAAATKKVLEDIGAAPSEKIDIEIELASIHRAFCRAEEAMRAKYAAEQSSDQNPEVAKLFTVLEEMGYVYAARAKEVEVERESTVNLLMQEEVSLNDFLGSGPSSSKVEKEVDVYAGYISGVRPRDFHAATMLTSLSVSLGGSVGSLTIEEAFDMMDLERTGSISRGNFDDILGSFGLAPRCEAVVKAFSQSSLSLSSTSIPRSDYLALMSSLLPVLVPVPTKSGSSGSSSGPKGPAPVARIGLPAGRSGSGILRNGTPSPIVGQSSSQSLVSSSSATVNMPQPGNSPTTSSPVTAVPPTMVQQTPLQATLEPILATTAAPELTNAVDIMLEYLTSEGLVSDDNTAIPSKLLIKIASMGSSRLDANQQQMLSKMIGSCANSKVSVASFVNKALPS